MIMILALTVCFLNSRLFAQVIRNDPRELVGVSGEKTITAGARALRIPDNAKVLGVFDWDRNGRPELFAVSTDPLPGYDGENHLLVLSDAPSGGIRVERHYVIRDAPVLSVEFFVPPDPRDTVKMAIYTLGGAYWVTVYLLESGFHRPAALGGATSFEFVDLNNDGIYEAVAWDRRPNDLRCNFGVFAVRVMPKIFARDVMAFKCVWPFNNAGWHEVMSQFTDLDHDGTAEIVSLEDTGSDRGGAQRLAAYKMQRNTFRMIAEVATPWPQIAYFFNVTEKGGIKLETASREKCATGGIRAGEGTDAANYVFRNGALRKLPPSPPDTVALPSPALEFVTIPAGRFWMGCFPENNECWPAELPRHEVEITRSFQISKYEITQGQWINVMGGNPSKFKGDKRRPIDSVSWNDVQLFIGKLNAQNDGFSYRLPTEAEWEYAARSGTTGPLYGKLDEISWHAGNSNNRTHPVGQKLPNSFGLYDVIGNVSEICSDWLAEDYFRSSPRKDPKGPASGNFRVLRGSAFADGYALRVSWRFGRFPEKDLDIGFRVCRAER